ncbi:cell division protein ZapE [Terricaulis silvestris]|uniref:DnaA regulatory inactivator Hda n=1 Tax=Terricaulis silvestris TaxID=2686094 RepID=A0A6I6MN41_9CAUL|nr:cell division protein ZapE [Terricaulis silvestris]QGZ96740.1 DnaA regulatory inactivator Hda [Terricaulis silvestris]
MTSVLAAYRDRLASGDLAPDAAQEAVAMRLDALAEDIARWRPDAWLGKTTPPRGLYIWGPVGRGKSMLLDLFFETAPVKKKRRVHFHEFMLARHAFLRDARARGPGQDQLIAEAAKDVASDARLLCFDEIQVTDIADAMILGRLFERLFAEDVVIVATSNRAPDDLYKNGLNRQLFTPFIGMLKQKLDVIELSGPHDYRLRQLMAAPVWYAPLGPAADEKMDQAWRRLTAGAVPQAVTLDVGGRALRVEREAAGVARFSFEELCARPLGAADYLEIAERFHTVLLENIPRLSPAKREEAARFRTLVDAIYEAKVKLIASAEAVPVALYPEGDQSFEFERTASRLMEMRSETYLALPRRDAEWKSGIVE